MLERLYLFAQDTARYNRGLSIFQWGLTGVGIAIIGLGAALFLAKSKDAAKTTSPAVRWITMAVCCLIGLAIIAYAWLGFTGL